MIIPAFHPALLGPAILYHLKRGKAITHITVIFTHGQIHRIFSPRIAEKYPLEMTLGGGRDLEKKIDCRLFEVPWNIDIRTKQQKKQKPIEKALAETPPEQPEMDPKLVGAIQALFEEPSHRAELEYRLSVATLQKTVPRVSPGRPHQSPRPDTAHAQ